MELPLLELPLLELPLLELPLAYNLGVGKGVSVREVIDSFQKVNNLKFSYKLGPRRAGDVEKI